MATFATITEKEAPPKPKGAGRLAARMHEFDGYITAIKKGEVGKLAPDEGETTRGLAMRVSRAGGRHPDRPISVWTVEGTVYFKLI